MYVHRTAKLEYNEPGHSEIPYINLYMSWQISYFNLEKIAAYNEHGYNEFMPITKSF